jgi:ATP-dependent 26S proteasome regulatory subunit
MAFCEQVLREGARRAEATNTPLPDLLLGQRYGLTNAELFILWLALVPCVEPSARGWLQPLLPRDAAPEVSVSLCFRLLCEGRGDKVNLLAALSPQGRLLGSGLLRRVRAGHNPLDDLLIPHEQVVHCFCGQRAVSASAATLAASLTSTLTLDMIQAPPRVHTLRQLIDSFQARAPLSDLPALSDGGMGFAPGALFLLHGPAGSGRATTLKALAGTLGRRLLRIDGDLLAAMSVRDAAAAIDDLCLEGELFGDLLCVHEAGSLMEHDSKLAPLFARALSRRAVVVVLCAQGAEGNRVAGPLSPFALFSCRVGDTPSTPGPQLWQANLPSPLVSLRDVSFAALSQRITLTPIQVRKATTLAYLLADPSPDAADPDDARVALTAPLLERAAREQIPRSIGAMATVTEPSLSFDDLVVDDDTHEQILEIIAAARHRRVVLNEWGVGARIQRGTGIVVLFDGDPGTGKTHAAEVIASTLGLSLVRINIASIVDKYIGETEKNLTEIFSSARPDTSLLLFDEADSLFSKRTSDVSKSTDRYSNMNINVLLQLIERYEGVAVLTTNLKKAIDPAFERRFTYKIHFNLPDAPQRERLWQYLLPTSVQVGEVIDYERLSSIEMSGGEIKNAILLACYYCVRHQHLLTNDSLYDAASREAAASGRMVRR